MNPTAIDRVEQLVREFSPEAKDLLALAEENIRGQGDLSNDAEITLRINSLDQSLIFTWEPDLELSKALLSGENAFEEGFQLLQGDKWCLLLHIDAFGSAYGRFERSSEANIIDFMAERSSRDYLVDLNMTELSRAAFPHVSTNLPDPDIYSDPLAYLGALHNESITVPSLVIPDDALLNEGQRQNLKNLMECGAELDGAYLFVNEKPDKSYNPGSETGLRKILDDVHLFFYRATCCESLSEDAIDRVQECVGFLRSALHINSEYGEHALFARDEFEIMVAYAKGLAVIDDQNISVVGSEPKDETWHDFSTRDPYEFISEENSVRYTVLAPSLVYESKLLKKRNR
jgi:hypothetical protein